MWRTDPPRSYSAFAFLLCVGGFAGAAEIESQGPVTLPPESRPLAPCEVELEYIAHACFRLRSPDGARILVDPFASRLWLGYDFPAGLEADAVLITHPHYDHDGGRRMKRDTSWMKGMQVHEAPGSFDLGEFRVTGVAGKHADPYGKEFGQVNTIWVIEIGGLRLVHLGDNGALESRVVEAVGRVDVLLAPIDAREHILHARELADIRAALRPRLLVPMHYRLPDLELDPNRPEDLGEIEPWLEHERRVRRLDRHVTVLSRATLPEADEVLVFRHSPAVVRPAAR